MKVVRKQDIINAWQFRPDKFNPPFDNIVMVAKSIITLTPIKLTDPCKYCKNLLVDHGALLALKSYRILCPGDWAIYLKKSDELFIVPEQMFREKYVKI